MYGEIGLSLPDCYHFTNQTTSSILPDYTIHQHHQLYDKLLFQSHPGMEFTATTTKPWPIMLKILLIMVFWALLKKLPIMLNIMPITTAIMPQFMYNFINFSN